MKTEWVWKYLKGEEGGEKESRKYLSVQILVTLILWRHWPRPPRRVAACASDDIVSCFWPVSWLKISVVFTVDPVKTKEIFTTLFIHIFNCVESTCLLRLKVVPSLQKQVYARLTRRMREKEKSFSVWALHRQARIAIKCVCQNTLFTSFSLRLCTCS